MDLGRPSERARSSVGARRELNEVAAGFGAPPRRFGAVKSAGPSVVQRGLGAGSGFSFFGALGSTCSGGFCAPRFSGGALGWPFASYTSVYVPFFFSSSSGGGAVGATWVAELPGLLAGGGVVPLGRGVVEGFALGAVREGGGSGRVSVVPEATGRGVAGECVGLAGVALWLGACGDDAAAPAGGGGGGGG